MTVLPEIERQIVEAAGRHYVATGPRPAQVPAWRRRWRSPRALAVVLSLTVAVPAVAATQPWTPLLGDASVDGVSPRVAAGVVPEEQRELLGVLRRDQTDQDRSVATRGLLTSLAPPTDGVRLGDVRLLASGDGPSVGLVPVEKLYKGMPGEGAEVLARDGLCLTTGDAVRCGTTSDVRAGRLSGTSGTFAYGLVPDGVAVVRFALPGGRSITADVRDNFYGATLPAPSHQTGDAGTFGLQREPADESPKDSVPITVTWLDASGGTIPRG